MGTVLLRSAGWFVATAAAITAIAVAPAITAADPPAPQSPTSMPTPVTQSLAPVALSVPVAQQSRPVPTALGQQMQAAIEAVSPDTQVGIDVIDTRTGAVIAALNPDQQFYTASVVKLLIALDALNSQGWQPDSATGAQIQQMLSASDDNVADTLWDADGGDAIIDRMIDLIGLPETQPPTDPAQWGETRTTPDDVVTLYHFIAAEVPEPSRTVIMNALLNTDEIAADGTDQYFGIPTGLSDTVWAVKQGWMSLNTSTTLDTTGLVGLTTQQTMPYTIVLLTTQPAGIDWPTGFSALTAGVDVLRGVIG